MENLISLGRELQESLERSNSLARRIADATAGVSAGAHRGRIEAPRAPTAANIAGTPRRGTSRSRQRKGTISRWTADNRARRVPAFVTDMTGLDSAVKIKAKYGNGTVFEKGKPAPKPLAKS
jgi:hypothetical protein